MGKSSRGIRGKNERSNFLKGGEEIRESSRDYVD